MLKTTQEQMQSLNTSVNQDRDRQLVIERTIADEQALASVPVAPKGAQEKNGKPAAVDANAPASQQLAAARAQLAQLELRLTDDHPDVRAAKRHITELEQKASDEALQRPARRRRDYRRDAGGRGAPEAPRNAAQRARQP